MKADDSFAANNQTLSEAGDELSAGLETDRFRLPGTVFRFAADTNLSRVALRYRAPIRVNIKRIAAGVPLLAPARVHSTDCRDCVGCAAVDLSAAAKRFLWYSRIVLSISELWAAPTGLNSFSEKSPRPVGSRHTHRWFPEHLTSRWNIKSILSFMPFYHKSVTFFFLQRRSTWTQLLVIIYNESHHTSP